MSAAQTPTTNTDWYVLRGELKYGPYDYRTVIGMIQNAELYNYNYAWADHLENWTMLAELPEFSKDRLCRLIENPAEVSSSFIDRKVPRKEITVPIYAHNDFNFFDGQSVSLSVNGGLSLLNDPLLLPGQKIMITFRQAENNPQPFNVVCEIICKNYSKQRLNVKSGLHYAVRFLQVQDHGLAQLTIWTREDASKGETNGIFKVHE